MKVDIALGEDISPGVPRPMFEYKELNLYRYSPVTGFSVDQKGERFLFSRYAETIDEEFQAQEEPITKLNLVVNWFEELKRLVPME